MRIAPDKAIHLAANSSPPSIARPMVSKIQSYLWKRFKGNFPSFVDNSPRSHDRTFSAENMDGYYVHPSLQHPIYKIQAVREFMEKRRFKYIYLPSYSPFWIQLSVLVKVLVRCREVWHRRQRKGQGNPQTLSPALIATPGKGILFWALLSGRRNVICFWRKSSLQCMRLTSVYWFKFCSRQYNDLHRSSTQLSVHRNAPSNTEEIGFPGHGFFFRRTIKCPA